MLSGYSSFTILLCQKRTKMKITLILCLLITISVFAQTQVSGVQTGIWNASGSPYNVVGTVTVPIGELLTIEPGVEVNFQGYYQFVVNGELQALGAEADSIFFTTNDITTGWGGIRIDSDDIATLSYCRIEYGKTAGDYPDIHGGGLALLGSNAIVSNCVFADNDATGNDNGMGGAIYAFSTEESIFTDCVFTRNHAYGEGGAIKFSADNFSELTNCLFIENDCLYGGGAVSGYMIAGTKFTSCLFADNYTMYSSGGAIQTLGGGNTLYIINCTISENTAVTGDGGGVFLAYGTGYFVNSIVYNNPGMYSDDVYLSMAGFAEAYYCDLDVACGATGTNNFFEDPQFVNPDNGDFNLLSTSACIDTGIALFILEGDTLVNMDSSEYFGTAPDIGAYEYDDGTGFEAGTILPQSELVLDQNSPNPFSSSTYINYGLPLDSYVSLTIFDLFGREVKTLIDREECSGFRSIVWNGTNSSGERVPAGIYIVRLQADILVKNIKVQLLNL